MCGKIRYESTAFPALITNCLCVQCRQAAGGAYQSFARLPRSAVTWLTEEPKYFKYISTVRRGFCNTCGSSLTFENEHRPGRLSISPGSFDDWEVEGGGNKIGKPQCWVYTGEKAAWFDVPNDGLQRFEGNDEG